MVGYKNSISKKRLWAIIFQKRHSRNCNRKIHSRVVFWPSTFSLVSPSSVVRLFRHCKSTLNRKFDVSTGMMLQLSGDPLKGKKDEMSQKNTKNWRNGLWVDYLTGILAIKNRIVFIIMIITNKNDCRKHTEKKVIYTEGHRNLPTTHRRRRPLGARVRGTPRAEGRWQGGGAMWANHFAERATGDSK